MEENAEIAAEQKRMDDELRAHQAEEIEFLNQQMAEFQRDRDEDRSTISKLKIYRSDFVAATEQIQEYERQIKSFQERENEGLANLEVCNQLAKRSLARSEATSCSITRRGNHTAYSNAIFGLPTK